MTAQTRLRLGAAPAMTATSMLQRRSPRQFVALALGWLSYGLFYLTVAAIVIGLPVALLLYLFRLLRGH